MISQICLKHYFFSSDICILSQRLVCIYIKTHKLYFYICNFSFKRAAQQFFCHAAHFRHYLTLLPQNRVISLHFIMIFNQIRIIKNLVFFQKSYSPFSDMNQIKRTVWRYIPLPEIRRIIIQMVQDPLTAHPCVTIRIRFCAFSGLPVISSRKAFPLSQTCRTVSPPGAPGN